MVTPYNYGHDTIVQGRPYQPFMPLQGMPGGMMSQMAASTVMGAFNQAGVPLGFHGAPGATNLYNNVRMQMYTQAHMQGMEKAVVQDTGRIVEYARGMAQATGQPFGAEQAAAIRNSMAKVAPLAAVLPPELIDAAAGGRSQAAMFHQMHMGGRYRLDPVSGFTGLSADSANFAAKGLFQHYYSDPKAGLTKASGLSANEMGSMFGELTRRGLMAGPGTNAERTVAGINAMGRSAQEAALGKVGIDIGSLGGDGRGGLNLGNLSDSQIRGLQGQEGVQAGIRRADTGKIANTLDKYKGAVSAVKEIFGDEGRPNAPFRELWNMLETLSAGSVQQMDKGRLEMTVRNMRNAADKAGITMQGMSRMMTMAGSDLQAMGMNPAFATQMVPAAMNFREAYNAIGGNAQHAWGLRSADQLTMMDQQRRGRAIASPLANKLGALARLSGAGTEFTGQAGELLKQMRTGRISDEFIRMGRNEFVDMLAAGSDVSTAEAARALQHKTLNEEAIFTENLGGVVTQAQKREYMDKILGGQEGGAFHTIASMSVRERLGRAGGALSKTISSTLAETIGGMDDATFRDARLRGATAATALMNKLGGTAEGREYLAAMGGDEATQRKRLIRLAHESYGQAEKVGRERFGIDYLVNPQSIMEDATGERTLRNKKSTELNSILQSIHGGQYDPNAMRRLMTGLARGDGNLQKLIGTTLGLDNEHIGELAKSLWSIDAKRKAVGKEREALGKKIDLDTASDAEISRYKELLAEESVMGEEQQKLQKYLERPDVAEKLAEKIKKGGVGPGEADQGAGGGVPGTFNMSGVTININGQLISKDGSGTIKGNPTGKGEVTTGA